MKFDLTWRYKHKIGEIEITDDRFMELLKLSYKNEPLCLAPSFKISYDGNLETIKDIEIMDLSIIPLSMHAMNKDGELARLHIDLET